MSTTLTNGLKLPDKGSVAWYADMQSNYTILDGAVGTIAEHTSALAGKAPAVHTHTKSDVTDLLNSNFIPSANNSYDLGSSSYQWNTLYAKNYYYNGVAWGLDKTNTWSAENTYTYAITLKQTNLEEGVLPASTQTKRYRFTDKNNADLGWLQHRINTSGDSYLEFYVVNKFSNGQLSSQGSEIANVLNLGLHSDGSRYLTVTGDVYPDLPGRVCNLGTSTNKWKTLNGINPGALSLPDIAKYTDLTSNIPSASLDGSTEINLSSYITTKGWLAIVVPDTNTDDFVFCQNGSTLSNRYFMSGARGNGFISLMMPINNAGEVKVQIKASSVSFCRFYPGLGNV